jgi:hypothetical protein
MASDAVVTQYGGFGGNVKTQHLNSVGAISSNQIGYCVYNAKNRDIQAGPFPDAASADSYITSHRNNRPGNSADGLCVVTVPLAS